MPRYFAFLRAINVGGHTVKMDVLRRHFESLGFANVETFIASGNAVFETNARSTTALETRIEQALRAALGYEVATFIRTPAELAAIAAHTPFPPAALDASQALNIAFLREPLGKARERKLMTLRTDIDDFHTNAREIYWLCKRRQSESTFSNNLFEKTVGVPATFRGVSTVRKLAAKYGVIG